VPGAVMGLPTVYVHLPLPHDDYDVARRLHTLTTGHTDFYYTYGRHDDDVFD